MRLCMVPRPTPKQALFAVELLPAGDRCSLMTQVINRGQKSRVSTSWRVDEHRLCPVMRLDVQAVIVSITAVIETICIAQTSLVSAHMYWF